jgi:lysylphosphatidylglycerol synthetase-like protein (DUF2156 family)
MDGAVAMKQSIPTPIFILAVVVVVIGVAALIWSRANPASGTSNADVEKISKEMISNQRNDVPVVPRELIDQKMHSMGGGGKR